MGSWWPSGPVFPLCPRRSSWIRCLRAGGRLPPRGSPGPSRAHNPHSFATLRIALARLLLRQLPHFPFCGSSPTERRHRRRLPRRNLASVKVLGSAKRPHTTGLAESVHGDAMPTAGFYRSPGTHQRARSRHPPSGQETRAKQPREQREIAATGRLPVAGERSKSKTRLLHRLRSCQLTNHLAEADYTGRCHLPFRRSTFDDPVVLGTHRSPNSVCRS